VRQPALKETPPSEAEVRKPGKWRERKIVMTICRRDQSGKMVCVKDGFEMVVRVAEPEVEEK